jgi:hypothetical protein
MSVPVWRRSGFRWAGRHHRQRRRPRRVAGQRLHGRGRVDTGQRGRPRHRPDKLHADKAYDVRALRAEVRRRGIAVRIAHKGVESSEKLGRHRWIVESCLAWLQNDRRLVRRYERKADRFHAFADLGYALLCYRRLTKNNHLE